MFGLVRDVAKILFIPLVELVKALRDQTHFHAKSFVYYASLSGNIFVNFFKYCFIFYYVHVHHLWYLRTIGFLGHKELENDSGSFKLFSDKQEWSPVNENIGGVYNNVTGNVAHCPISSMALDQMMTQLTNLMDITNSVFIDFGCGSGFPCIYAMRHPFLEVIGVENHKASASLAEANMMRMVQSNGGVCQCNHYQVLNQDMQMFDFSFKSCRLSTNPSSVKSIVLYFYEPLWTLSKAEAHGIYSSVLSHAIYNSPTTMKEVYFVYLFAGMYGGDALTILDEFTMKLLPDVVQLKYEGQYMGLFFGYADNMYIYKADLSKVKASDRKRKSLEDKNHPIMF